MGKLIEDTRQKIAHGDKHEAKHKWWAEHGVEVERAKLDAGDYLAEGSNIVVDTKRNIAEVAQNINGRQHDRFRRECERARDAGYKLVVLVENAHGYTSVDDVRPWVNSHCRFCKFRRSHACNPRDGRGKCARHGTQKPIQGWRLAKAMHTMNERYGVEFEFCAPDESARRVCELLGVDYDS